MKILTGMERRSPLSVQRVQVFVLCLVCCVLSVPRSFAENRPLKIAVFQARPYGFLGENGEMQGIMVDQIEAIMTEANLPYEMVLANFSRTLHELQRGDVDMTLLHLSDAVLEVAECIETTITHKNIVVGRKGTNLSSVTDLYDLQKPVGTSRGAKYGEMFDDDTAIPKYLIDRYEQGVQMLFGGRLDAVVGVEDAIYKVAKELGYSRDQFGVPLLIKEVKGCVYFSRTTAPQWQAEQQKLKDIVKHLKEEGVFEEIEQQWIQ